MDAERTRVFVSYTHDSVQHKLQVKSLADKLREHGIDSSIDQYEESPEIGWPMWMDQQIAGADYVLVVCSEAYCRRASGEDKVRHGKGGRWESFLTYQELYEMRARNQKFIPVVFSQDDVQQIPRPLRSFTYYNVASEDGYRKLYRRLSGQAGSAKPKLGGIVPEGGSQEQRDGRQSETGAVATSEGTIQVELTLQKRFEDFSEKDERAIGKAICDLLGIGRVIVRERRRGSTKLILDMSPEQADVLLWRVQEGELAHLGVVAARIIVDSAVKSVPTVGSEASISSIHQPFWRQSRKYQAKISCDIFISYAKEDEAIVRSIYDDLTRSKLKVWEFKKKSELGVDFEQEFKWKIENSRYFCLMDSSHSRKAKYVQMECLYAIQIKEKKGFPRIIVCKVEGGREWREKEIFPRQNYITRIDFTSYEEGIKRLCKFLNVLYSPCFTLPRDKDFAEEMSKLSMYQSQISTEDWQNLMGNYEGFRKQYHKNKKYAEALLTVIILQSKELGIQLKTPYLALGVLQAGSNRHEDALETFETASQKFRDDPRFWAGLGGAQYYLTKYKLAVESYCHCIEMIKRSQNEIHRSHFVEVVHNLEEALCALGEHSDAYNKITSQYQELLEYPEIQAIIGKILVHLGKADQSRGYLENAYENYKCKHDLTLEEEKFFFSLILTLAECYKHLKIIKKEQQILTYGIKVFSMEPEVWRRYAIFFWETNNSKSAKKKVKEYLEKAVVLSGGHVKYRAELALILHEIEDESGFREQLEACFILEKNRAITTAIDDYYLGLAYFLDNKLEIARKQYEFSKADKKIAKWPYYDQLTSKKY